MGGILHSCHAKGNFVTAHWHLCRLIKQKYLHLQKKNRKKSQPSWQSPPAQLLNFTKLWILFHMEQNVDFWDQGLSSVPDIAVFRGKGIHGPLSLWGSTPWQIPELPAPAAGPTGGCETINAKTSGDKHCPSFRINGKSNRASDCSMADATGTKGMSWACGGTRWGNSKTTEKDRKEQK